MIRTFSLMISVGTVLACSPSNSTTLGQQTAPPVSVAGESAAPAAPTRLTTEFLPNAVQIHPRVISGGLPEGDAAFGELARLGIKTIISVDGARPDVAAAKKYGIRYVHLPHGYDGIPGIRVKELAKAVRDLDGPIYIHCHHGKHRSPAAATVACVTAGLIPPAAALPVLALAGTSTNYRGLYQSAQRAHPWDSAVLDAIHVDFRETVDVPPMAEAMVALEHTHDHLKALAESGWRTPPDHPDLDPVHEALLLQEHFTELLRTVDVQQRPQRFQQLLRDSESAARELTAELDNWTPVSGQAPPALFGQLEQRIASNCMNCHKSFRDTPLSEKN